MLSTVVCQLFDSWLDNPGTRAFLRGKARRRQERPLEPKTPSKTRSSVEECVATAYFPSIPVSFIRMARITEKLHGLTDATERAALRTHSADTRKTKAASKGWEWGVLLWFSILGVRRSRKYRMLREILRRRNIPGYPAAGEWKFLARAPPNSVFSTLPRHDSLCFAVSINDLFAFVPPVACACSYTFIRVTLLCIAGGRRLAKTITPSHLPAAFWFLRVPCVFPWKSNFLIFSLLL